MLFFIILLLSTFFSIYHLIGSCKYKDTKILYPVKQSGMSVIVPCYNEALIIGYTIEGLLNLKYENKEVIFINDGSTDETFEVLSSLLDLTPMETDSGLYHYRKIKGVYISNKYLSITVIDKSNSGKADSLNTGISFSRNELIVTMDADCILEPNALASMNMIFDAEDIIAAGGVVHIMQLFKLDKKLKLITLLQALDYVKGFFIYKASLAYNDALSIISGAFGVFRKSALLELGGFRSGLGEDIDITLRLQEYALAHDKRVVFNRNAICYTECPESFQELIKQRVRWQKGFIDAIVNNNSFLLHNIFRSSLCFHMLVDALLSNSFACIVFIINTILVSAKFLYGYPPSVLVYYFNTVLFNILSSVIAIRIAKRYSPKLNTRHLYFMIIFDMLVFQFIRVYFFIKGTIAYYFNNTSWQKVQRTNNLYRV